MIVVLDESTSPKGDRKVGPSLCFWAAYVYDPMEDDHMTSAKISEESRYEVAVLMKSANMRPRRSGAIYNDEDTPIKISLDGIARALEACRYLVDKHSVKEVIVCGDCEPAIKLASGERRRLAASVVSICERIDNQKGDYSCPISFKHIRENEFLLYRDIDALSKEIRSRIEKTL